MKKTDITTGLFLFLLSITPAFADQTEETDTKQTFEQTAWNKTDVVPPQNGEVHTYTGEDTQVRCRQKRLSLYCNARPKTAAGKLRLYAELNGDPLPEPSFIPLNSEERPVQVLMMVDTSDPRREADVRKHGEQIKQIVKTAGSEVAVGLAGFDHGLNLISTPTRNHDIASKVGQLQAAGKITELYRSLLQGIDLLAETQADRRAIFIFSDGLAEDTAYTLPETVERANAAGVIIYGIGYTRSASSAINLQTLRRLAKETGGSFYENTRQNKLPDHFPDDPFAELLTGGVYIWDMSPASEQPGPNENTITIYSITDTGGTETTLLSLPVIIPRPIPDVQKEVVAPTQQVIIEKAQETQASNQSIFLLLFLALALLLLILLLVNRELLRRKEISIAYPEEGKNIEVSQVAPYGYLIMEAPETHIYKITRVPWRIGRIKNNDLVLDDQSISRRHAEVSYLGGGQFELQDLGSSNGLFINNKQIDKAPLKNNDLIDVGDIKLRFTLADPAEPPESETVFVQTRMPEG